MDARQRVQLTGPNRSIALESSNRSPSANTRVSENTGQGSRITSILIPDPRHLIPASTAGWPWRGCPTRSHPELDRETPQRRWYCVSRRGRVGRRPALKAETRTRNQQIRPTRGGAAKPTRAKPTRPRTPEADSTRTARTANAASPKPSSRRPQARSRRAPGPQPGPTGRRNQQATAPTPEPAPAETNPRGVEQPGSSSGS